MAAKQTENRTADLRADLKSGKFRRAYLFFGEESYLIRYYRKKLIAAVSGGDSMNLTAFEGKDTSEDDVIAAAETLPFFAERRMVLVEGSGWFRTSLEKLPDYLGTMPESTVLLFIEAAVDKRNRLYRAVQKCGLAAEFPHPDRAALAGWAARYLAYAGKKITASTMDRFLDLVGDDMENAQNELDKLISYVGERDVVDARDVDTITATVPEDRVFQMTDAIAARRTREAMRLYEDLLALKVSPTLILYLIAKRYNQLLTVKELTAAGKRSREIARALKISSGAAGHLAADARSMQSASLFRMVERCVELEEKIKTGDMNDRLAVELLIFGT